MEFWRNVNWLVGLTVTLGTVYLAVSTPHLQFLGALVIFLSGLFVIPPINDKIQNRSAGDYEAYLNPIIPLMTVALVISLESFLNIVDFELALEAFLGPLLITENSESSPTQDDVQTQPSRSPSEVVKSYLNNFDEGNIDQAYSLLSEQIKAEERTEVLEQKRSMQRIDDTRGSDFSIEVPTTEVVNESDTESTLRVEIDLYTLDRYTDTINRTVSLVKEDGEWRLSEVPKPYDRDGNNLGLGQ